MGDTDASGTMTKVWKTWLSNEVPTSLADSRSLLQICLTLFLELRLCALANSHSYCLQNTHILGLCLVYFMPLKYSIFLLAQTPRPPWSFLIPNLYWSLSSPNPSGIYFYPWPVCVLLISWVYAIFQLDPVSVETLFLSHRFMAQNFKMEGSLS